MIIGTMILIGSSSYATLSNVVEIRGRKVGALLSKTVLIGFGLLAALGLGAAITVIGISRDIEVLEILGEVILILGKVILMLGLSCNQNNFIRV